MQRWASSERVTALCAQVHFVLTHLHTLDADKAGKFTYNELLVLFRALPVNLPGGGRLAGGFPKAKVGTVHSRMGLRQL